MENEVEAKPLRYTLMHKNIEVADKGLDLCCFVLHLIFFWIYVIL